MENSKYENTIDVNNVFKNKASVEAYVKNTLTSKFTYDEKIEILGAIAWCLVFSGSYPIRWIWEFATKESHWSNDFNYIKEFNAAQAKFDAAEKQSWFVPFTENGTEKKAHAWYLPYPKKTNKTAVLLHGFRGPSRLMGPWAEQLFIQEGYNVLTPTLRGTWESEGEYLALGWNERQDIVTWMERIISVVGEESEIALFGISGGAATAMMASGLSLPPQVKVIIEDCGYTDAYHQLGHMLSIFFPAELIKNSGILWADILNKVNDIMTEKQGINLLDASAIDCLKNNEIPLQILQSSNDTVVLKEMAEKLYVAAKGDKEICFFDGIGHVEGILQCLPEYKTVIHDFISKYM
ncbi:alpha/beta hydrolase [Enterobacteriaceae bacterium LUAb1]